MGTVYAIDIRDYPGGKISSISSLLNFIVPLIMLVGAGFFLFMLLTAAFQWITAGDKADNVAQAQKTITFAVLGLILVAISYLLVKLIGVIFNISSSMPF